MVHCVVTGCRNKNDNSKASFFQFPKFKKSWKTNREKVHWDWVVKINRTDSNGTGKLWMPDRKSHVCSDHFEKECFTRDPDISKDLGFKQLRLKDSLSVIPTRFPEVKKSTPSPQTPTNRTPRTAYLKREHARVLKEIFINADHDNASATHVQPQTSATSPTPSATYTPPTPSASTSNTTSTCTDIDLDYREECMATETSLETNTADDHLFSQTPIQTKTYVKRTQTDWPSFSKTTQTTVDLQGIKPIVYRTIGTMTDNFGESQNKHCTCCSCTRREDNMEYEDEESDTEEDNDSDDDDWCPENEDIPSDCEEMEETPVDIDLTNVRIGDPVEERKYIVFESNLRELFEVCRVCSAQCRVVISRQIGTMIVIESWCKGPENHHYTWNSQPMTRRLPVGNLLLCGAILFSGNSVTDSLNVFKRCNIPCFTDRTFRYIQAYYLIPTLQKVWKQHQEVILNDSSNRSVKVGGDARCCSPGHTAKYSSYSLMDLETGLILDSQLVQTTEVSNSNAMELEGLKRCLKTLRDKNISVSDLTTDRHVQVRKFMRCEEPNIQHWFDCWHIAKSVYRKLLGIAKKKGCELVGEWAHSISNHMYWSAATSHGDGDLVEEKWTSVANHVVNIHEGHGERYVACPHDVILDNRKWINLGSKAHKELKDVVLNGRLLKDIRKLSPAEQTSKLEAFHKVVCHFAAKFQHFFYDAMKARTILAVLHHNENVNRQQARDKDGLLKYRISYPKAKKGDHTVKKVLQDCTYAYVEELLKATIERREQYPSYKLARSAVYGIEKPPPMSASANKVDKQTAIQQHKSRFNI